MLVTSGQKKKTRYREDGQDCREEGKMEMKGGEEGSREPLVVSLCMSWGGGSVGRLVLFVLLCPF